MAHDCPISHRTKQTQAQVLRIACRETSLKAISIDSGIPYSTLRSYAGHSGETAEMPVSALYKLIGVIPDELLSLLLPEGRRIVIVSEEVDHDDIARAMHDYMASKTKAHCPESPAGREISPCEDEALRSKLTVLQGRTA